MRPGTASIMSIAFRFRDTPFLYSISPLPSAQHIRLQLLSVVYDHSIAGQLDTSCILLQNIQN